MKIVNEKDYRFLGFDKNWIVCERVIFENKNWDPELLYLKKCLYKYLDGRSVLLTAPEE